MDLERIFRGPMSPSKWDDLGRYLRSQEVTAGDGVRVSRDVRGTVISANRKRIRAGGADSSHPFKLTTRTGESALELYVQFGLVEFPQVSGDSASHNIPWWKPEAVLWDGESTGLTGDPDHSEGSVELAEETTYGVWIKVPMNLASTALTSGGGLEATAAWYTGMNFIPGAASSPRLVISESATSATQGGTLVASTAGFGYFFVGTVTTDDEGGATIDQYRFSDLILPPFSMADVFLTSDDSDNLLDIGSDGFPTLSEDDVVVTLVGGTDVSATDDGGGQWTIDYTGS